MYLSDIYTVTVNLAGVPAISVPCGRSSAGRAPIGLQLIGNHFDEARLLNAARLMRWPKSETLLLEPPQTQRRREGIAEEKRLLRRSVLLSLFLCLRCLCGNPKSYVSSAVIKLANG